MANSESPPQSPTPDLSYLSPLVAPVIPAIIDPDDPEGLVRAGTAGNDLEVLVPMWSEPPPDGMSDIARLFWGTPPVEVDHQVVTAPVDPTVVELLLKVPKAYLQADGRYEVFYRVDSWSGTPTDSLPRTLTLDSQPPGEGLPLEPLLLPDDLEHGLIDQAYLDSHAGIVELRMPRPLYGGAKAGDVLALYWTQTIPPTGGALKTKTISQAELDAQDIRVQLLASEIGAPGTDGAFHALYRLSDRAGNETAFSKEAMAIVALGQGPGDYPAVDFPDADLWGYYLCEHKPWEGIRVRVPLAAGVTAGDRVILLWQGFATFNGLDPIDGTQGRFEEVVEAADLSVGDLDIWVQPYRPYIEPILSGSAIARYVLVKSTGLPGLSKQSLVKIDRRCPDGSLCGPAPSVLQVRETWWRRLLRWFRRADP
jgi:hypothetical protein